MKKRMVLVLCALLMSLATAPSGQTSGWSKQAVILNGGLVQLKHPLRLERGRALISASDAAKLLNLTCSKGAGKIAFRGERITLELKVGCNTAVVLKQVEQSETELTTELNVPPRLIETKLYVPLRFIAETFGWAVAWDPATHLVLIASANTALGEGTPVTYTILGRKELQGCPDLAAWYQQNFQTKGIFSLELDQDTYVLFCAGMKPTGGFGIKIESAVLIEPGSLFITASLAKPGPQDFVTMALTYPNVLLKFPDQKFQKIDGSLSE